MEKPPNALAPGNNRTGMPRRKRRPRAVDVSVLFSLDTLVMHATLAGEEREDGEEGQEAPPDPMPEHVNTCTSLGVQRGTV